MVMIKRWELHSNCGSPSMSTTEDGEFVLYEDHCDVVNHLNDVLHGIKTQVQLQKEVSLDQDKEWFDHLINAIEQEIDKSGRNETLNPFLDIAQGEN